MYLVRKLGTFQAWGPEYIPTPMENHGAVIHIYDSSLGRREEAGYSWGSLARHPSQLVGSTNERSYLQSLTRKWLKEYIWHQPLASTCTHIHTHESQHTHASTERKKDREDSENNKHCLTIISRDIISVIISDSGLLNHPNIIFLSLNSESRPPQHFSINYFIFPP